MPEHCIIMADIVASSDYEGAAMMRAFRAMVDRANAAHATRLLSPLTITLGDEFQGVPVDVPAAIDIVLELEEQRVRQGALFKLRYVIRTGTIDTPINPHSAHQMVGEGLAGARRQLAELKKNRHARIGIAIAPAAVRDALSDMFAVYFSLVDDWKEKDLDLVEAFLDELDNAEAARRVNRSRTSVLRRYRSLRIAAYHAARRLLHYLAREAA